MLHLKYVVTDNTCPANVILSLSLAKFRMLSCQHHARQKNHLSSATATHSHSRYWQAQRRNLDGPLHT